MGPLCRPLVSGERWHKREMGAPWTKLREFIKSNATGGTITLLCVRLEHTFGHSKERCGGERWWSRAQAVGAEPAATMTCTHPVSPGGLCLGEGFRERCCHVSGCALQLSDGFGLKDSRFLS